MVWGVGWAGLEHNRWLFLLCLVRRKQIDEQRSGQTALDHQLPLVSRRTPSVQAPATAIEQSQLGQGHSCTSVVIGGVVFLTWGGGGQ